MVLRRRRGAASPGLIRGTRLPGRPLATRSPGRRRLAGPWPAIAAPKRSGVAGKHELFDFDRKRASVSHLEPLIEQIRQLLVEKIEPRLARARIQPHTPLFAGGLGLNSFAVVDLIGQLEQRFHFQFREADFREECFRDLHALATLIDSYQSTATAPRSAS